MVTNGRQSRFSPLLQQHRFAVVSHANMKSPVAVILSFGCPSAVRFAIVLFALITLAAGVVSVGIDAVNLMPIGWCSPHVSNEGVNRIAPSLAREMAKPTVKPVIDILRIGTSLQHVLPDLVFASDRLTALRECSAPAADRQPALEVRCEDWRLNTALAPAIPHWMVPTVLRPRLNRQFPKDLWKVPEDVRESLQPTSFYSHFSQLNYA